MKKGFKVDVAYFIRYLASLRKADDATKTQWAYIAEAAFEYFISLTMSGAFFTLLVKQMGVSDAMTGILSSLSVFTCGVQIFATSILRKMKSIKKTSLVLQTIQQCMYSLLYLLPFLPIPGNLRLIVFAGLYVLASLMSNLITPAKFNWLMYFVKRENHGIFTAHKEMVSLITGLIYNYLMSLAVDHFDAIGKPKVGLLLCAVVIVVMMIFHIITLVIAKDAPEVLKEIKKTESLAASFKSNFSNPNFIKLFILCCGWVFCSYVASPYYSVFMLQEVGSTVTYISVVGIVTSLIRFCASPIMGKYCDKQGYAKGLTVGLFLEAAAIGLMTFWNPENGKVLYMIHSIILCVAMTSLSGGMSVIFLQYIPDKDKVGGLGIYSSISGMLGFVGSLVGGWILGKIQAGGNQIFGFSVYAQQVLSFLAFFGFTALAVYTWLVVQKMKRVDE